MLGTMLSPTDPKLVSWSPCPQRPCRHHYEDGKQLAQVWPFLPCPLLPPCQPLITPFLPQARMQPRDTTPKSTITRQLELLSSKLLDVPLSPGKDPDVSPYNENHGNYYDGTFIEPIMFQTLF